MGKKEVFLSWLLRAKFISQQDLKLGTSIINFLLYTNTPYTSSPKASFSCRGSTPQRHTCIKRPGQGDKARVQGTVMCGRG